MPEMEKTQTFEEAVSALEEIVRSLEEGGRTLEESLALFEQGVKLAKHCEEILNKYSAKVDMLVSMEDGNLARKSFIEE